MNSPVDANVRRSFRRLEQPVEFTQEFLDVCAASGTRAHRWAAPQRLTPFPIIYGVRSALSSPHEPWFGWYAARVAVRGVLLSVNYLLASRRMLQDQLLGPSVACAYTAAYHTLHAFLALRGRVICDPIQWVKTSAAPESPEAIAAVLTKANTWRFEARRRSHAARWLEVRDALRPGEVPFAFATLFASLFGKQPRKGVTAQEAILDPAGTRMSLEESWRPFLLSIAGIRHEALYSSFGEDPDVVSGLWNGELVSVRGIDRHARAICDFAVGLLAESAARMRILSSEVTIPENLKEWFGVVVQIPWFDRRHVDELPGDVVRSDVAAIADWASTGNPG